MNTENYTRFKLTTIILVIFLVIGATAFNRAAKAFYSEGAGNSPQWTVRAEARDFDLLWICISNKKCAKRYSYAVYRCFSKGRCHQLLAFKNRFQKIRLQAARRNS